MKFFSDSKATVSRNSNTFFQQKSKKDFFGTAVQENGFLPDMEYNPVQYAQPETYTETEEEPAITDRVTVEKDIYQTPGSFIEEYSPGTTVEPPQKNTGNEALRTSIEDTAPANEELTITPEVQEEEPAETFAEEKIATSTILIDTSEPPAPVAETPAEVIAKSQERDEKDKESTEEVVENTSDKAPGIAEVPEDKEAIQPEKENEHQKAEGELKSGKQAKEKEQEVAAETAEPVASENTEAAQEEKVVGEGEGGVAIEAPVAEQQEAAALDGTDTGSLLKSWTNAPPVSFIQNAAKVDGLATTAQEKEKTGLKESYPEIEQPTGIPPKQTAGEGEVVTGSGGVSTDVPQLQPEGEAVKVPVPVPAPVSKTPVNNTPIPQGIDAKSQEAEDEGSWWDRMAGKISKFLGGLKTEDNTVDTDPGKAPKVPLEGESDPQQNEKHSEEANASVDDEKSKSDEATQQYFGEDDVYPEVEPQMMTPGTDPAAPAQYKNAEARELSPIDGETAASFNIEAKAKMDEQVSIEMAKHEQAREQMESDSVMEREKTDNDIAAENAKTKAEQESLQSKAKSDVEGYRSDWKTENEDVKKEYADKSETKRKEIDGEIDTKVKETDTEVTAKYDEAKKKAETEKVKSEEEAARKKREEENKPRSWWQKIKDGVSSVFNAIKGALNKIFNALRSLVKGIIDAVKSVVVGLIDLARKAIVGLIKAFGEALKAFVNIALAAFPELAKKFNEYIDKAVNAAVDAVNKLADALKAAVEFLLNALASVLDAILGAFQAIYNAILDVLHFLVVGLMEILEGIANLVRAASDMPDHFWGQVSEEMLGVDITKPLPNEIPMPGNTQQAAQTKVENGEITQQEADIAQKTTLQTNDVAVDEVPRDFELDPELMTQLNTMPEEGDMMIDTPQEGGEQEVEAKKEEALTAEPAPETEQTTEGIGETTETSSPGAETATTGEEMSAEGGEMVGPFSGPGERLAHMASQMKEAIKKWWDENKVKIIAALVLGIAGVILANVLTGGAIMAALPLLMQIVAAAFAVQAIANATKYFGIFLKEGFAGNVMAGAVALARASAIILIELVTSLLFAGKGAVKGIKTAVKTVAKQGVKGALKTGAKTAKAAMTATLKQTGKAVKELGSIAKAGGKALLKNGKMVLKGIKNGFAKGAKSFGSLAKKLAQKLKLKRIKIVRKKWRFFIWGEFNPWVLLATGEIKEVDAKDVKGLKVGDEVAGGGILIGVREGDQASKLVKKLRKAANKAEAADLYKKLKGKTPDKRSAIIFGGKNTRKLRKGIAPPQPPGFEAHHIVPEELIDEFDDFFKKINFDPQNGSKNGIMIPPDDDVLAAAIKEDASIAAQFKNSAKHSGSHGKYTLRIKNKIDRIKTLLDSGKITSAEAAKRFDSIITSARNAIENGGGKKINDLKF
ncbi:MAG: AHH domain-containing protein [Chitinophagaceae bacterium]|nr:AHH domain-containing protein [Chitinophagaceae bacterium]